MKAIRSLAPVKSYRIPPCLRRSATRLGSLILLFQRMPIVQFLFPEANIIGGASLANSVSLAVTTVVGLGAYDSVAGATTIDAVSPLAVTGATSSRTSTTNAINVPATVSAPLNFEFQCVNAPSDPESWRIVTSGGAATTLPAGLTMTRTSTTSNGSGGFYLNNYITGTPTTAGTSLVYIRVYRDLNYGGENITQLFNICALGFTAQPSATPASISSGGASNLTCTATGIPVGTTRHPGNGTLTYQWYRGLTGDMSTPVGTTNATTPGFTTPALTATTNYWVRLRSVLGASTVYANSNTVAVNVTVTSSYESWASGLAVGQSGPTQTPQNDGVTNLEKFAFNLNPLSPDVRHLTAGAGALTESAGLPAGATVGGTLRIEFLRRKASSNPGITYQPQFSTSLGSWVDFSGTESVSAAADPAWERVTVDDTVGGTARFGRVKVAQTP